MKKVLLCFSAFVFMVASFAANTPSQLGLYQIKAPEKLNKK